LQTEEKEKRLIQPAFFRDTLKRHAVPHLKTALGFTGLFPSHGNMTYPGEGRLGRRLTFRILPLFAIDFFSEQLYTQDLPVILS